MTWIVTASGHEFSLRAHRADSITLADISHSLAQLNRFTGHARRPYSVAEHSLLVCEIVERMYSVDVHGRLAALMHDAHEAYIGDLHTPGKLEVGNAWYTVEHRVEHFVRSAFALHQASHTWKQAIKQADLLALATERAQLLPNPPGSTPWAVLTHIQPITWVDLMEHGRCSLNWRDWRQAFADKCDELDFERNQQLFPVPQR